MKKLFITLCLFLNTTACFAHSLININLSKICFSDGVPIPENSTVFGVTSGFFYDNGYNVSQAGYFQTSSYARATFSTVASSITVGMYNNGMYTYYGSNGYCSISVLVNGASIGQVTCTKSGAESQTFSLGAAGSKTVELRNGFIENRGESGRLQNPIFFYLGPERLPERSNCAHEHRVGYVHPDAPPRPELPGARQFAGPAGRRPAGREPGVRPHPRR
jgi:hypothetical protein